MSDFWRDRMDAHAREEENARARRLTALEDLLGQVLAVDEEVLDAVSTAGLRRALHVVQDLRRTW